MLVIKFNSYQLQINEEKKNATFLKVNENHELDLKDFSDETHKINNKKKRK